MPYKSKTLSQTLSTHFNDSLVFRFTFTQSTIDLVGYAAGATDEFRGTGVWSGIRFKRETPAEENNQLPVDSSKNDNTNSVATKAQNVDENKQPSK